MPQLKEDIRIAKLYQLIAENKETPGVGIILIMAPGGEIMESNKIKLPFMDAYHVRDHSAEHTFHRDNEDDSNEVTDVTRNEIPESELPIMQSYVSDDFNVELFPGVWCCFDKEIMMKTCGGSTCTTVPEPIYAFLFTPNGSFYADAIKAHSQSDYRYLPLNKIYSAMAKLGYDVDEG